MDAAAPSRVDVCVIGGGPAGCVIARHLAGLGHATLLLDRGSDAARQRAESLAPSIVPILESIGLSGVLDPAVFCRETSALVRWGSDQPQTKHFDSPSLLIDRTVFDRRLREAAASGGAHVVAPANASPPQRRRSGGWTIATTTADGPLTIEAEFLVDARGKRPGVAADARGPRMTSLSAVWHGGDAACAETRIEAGSDEWFWGCPLPGGLYSASVFVDATRAAGLSAERRRALCRRLLSRSALLKHLLDGETAGPVTVRDATSRIAKHLIEPGFIRVGEAAFSIDPLSSQGIQRAILSAVQGGAAVHTMRTMEDPHPAMAFFRDRQQHAALQAGRRAAELYREVMLRERSRFWTDRSASTDDAPASQHRRAADPMPLPPFVRLSDQLRVVDVPVLKGPLIAPLPALSHPHLDHPVAYLGGIALAPLASDMAGVAATEQLLDRWARHMPRETALQILRWMCAMDILVPDGKASAPAPLQA